MSGLSKKVVVNSNINSTLRLGLSVIRRMIFADYGKAAVSCHDQTPVFKVFIN